MSLDIKSIRTIYKVNFDKNGLKYHLSNHGITVIIPENAVDRDALLRIGVYYVDLFQFPHGYRLVSDVFWIAPFLYRNMLNFIFLIL